MQTGIRVLAAREEESQKALEEVVSPSTGSELTPHEMDAALADLGVNFKTYGFTSRQEAIDAFRAAKVLKNNSITVRITPQTPSDSRSSIGWTVLGL